VLIGDQGSGKTVKTVCLVEYIYDDYPVRTINNNFEGSMRKRYPWKNIIESKETEYVDENEAYEASLKSSGKVTIFTEIRKNRMIESFLNSGRRGSKFALTSMHHNEAQKVPYELAKGLMKDGLHRQISDAIEDVLEVLKIVEEVVVTEDGRRVYNIYELRNVTPKFESDIYKSIDRLTSTEDVMKVIAKSLVRLAQPVNYEVVPIVVYDKMTDSYLKINDLSEELILQLQRNIKLRDESLLNLFQMLPKVSL
ncbi:MAG: hypothetical protein JXO44_03325, partial [Clostridia bacterium]|nr:hypothetical protein [Clostridia bacterium]